MGISTNHSLLWHNHCSESHSQPVSKKAPFLRCVPFSPPGRGNLVDLRKSIEGCEHGGISWIFTICSPNVHNFSPYFHHVHHIFTIVHHFSPYFHTCSPFFTIFSQFFTICSPYVHQNDGDFTTWQWRTWRINWCSASMVVYPTGTNPVTILRMIL